REQSQSGKTGTAPGAPAPGAVTRCTPDGIRTHATAVRGRRPRPLDDGGRTRTRVGSARTGAPWSVQLAYQDSNLERLNQNQLCCQLHHRPLLFTSEPLFEGLEESTKLRE